MASTTLGHHHHHHQHGAASTAPSTPVHHHSHFAHHVRTRAWGIEPGWKFVSRESNKTHKVPINYVNDTYDNISRKSQGIGSSSNNNNGKSSGFETRFGGHSGGHSNVVGLSNGGGGGGSGAFGQRATSFRLPSSSLRQSTVASRSKTDDDCPIHHSAVGPGANGLHNHHHYRAYSSQQPSAALGMQATRATAASSTLPRSAKINYGVLDYGAASPLGSGGHSPSSSFSSSASSTSSSSSSSPPSSTVAEFVPQGVLKKPGSYRGPKSMKKVAFLENAEFSRGLP